MTKEYELGWRWKEKEYKVANRLFAKIFDLIIIYAVTLGIEVLLNLLGIELEIKLKYRLFLLVYLIYEVVMFISFKASLGKRLFALKYISKDHKDNILQFVIRLLSYLVLVAISVEIKFIIAFLMYYLIKSFDKFAGPYWDYKIKVIGKNELYIGKYILTMMIFFIVIFLSLSNNALLKDYVKDYKENGVESRLLASTVSEIKADDFDEIIYEEYISGDYESVIARYEEDEFVNQASAESYNFLGLSYMEVSKSEEAMWAFDYGLSIINSGEFELESAIYNNMSWAHNEMDEFELSIEKAEKAIELGDKSHYVYSNYANALFNLDRFEEALERYNDAIHAKDYEDNYVYSMIAECYYQMEDYKNASIYFAKYRDFNLTDPQSYYDLAWSKALEFEDYSAGMWDINEMLRLSENSAEAILVKAEFLAEFNQYKLLEEFLTQDVEESLVLEDLDLAYLLMEAYKYLELYDLAIELGNTVISSGLEDLSIWYMMLDVYYQSGKHLEAKNLVENYRLKNGESVETLLEVAYMYSYNYFYYESGAILEELIRNKDKYDMTLEQWEDALYEWLLNLYDSNDFDQFIEICEEYKDIVISSNLYHFLGLAYFEIGEYDLAMENYLTSIDIDPEGNYMYEDIIFLHIYNGDYDKAKEALVEAKNKGLDAEIYQEYDKYIMDNINLNPGVLIFNFIEENYMYYENSKELQSLKDELIHEKSISDAKYNELSRLAFGNDYFSFIIHGDEFNMYMEMEEEATVSSRWIDDENLYLRIDFFSHLTDTEFLRVIQDVDKSEEKTLILDVRSNFGGDLDSAMNILDYLIGNQYLGDWNSPLDEPYYYYSDGNEIKFKQIYILTDDESASSSELVALGIKEYIDGSVIIGETSFGKGVGQVSTNNIKYEYALFVVNAFWNINHINIHEIGIEPDIRVDDGTLDDYLDIILTN